METEHRLTQMAETVATITLNQPGKRNALSRALVEDMVAAPGLPERRLPRGDSRVPRETNVGFHGKVAAMSRNVVVHSGSLRYAQNISVGSHVLQADEPSDYGGNDVGPNPYELLLAALGACTSMTVQMYAARKQWPLSGVQVSLSHARIHAEDCAECETKVGMVDRIELRISFTGDLSQEQQRRLLEIADKCPVHRTLVSRVQIDTKVE